MVLDNLAALERDGVITVAEAGALFVLSRPVREFAPSREGWRFTAATVVVGRSMAEDWADGSFIDAHDWPRHPWLGSARYLSGGPQGV